MSKDKELFDIVNHTDVETFFDDLSMLYDEETEIACQRIEDREYLLSLKGDIFTSEIYND